MCETGRIYVVGIGPGDDRTMTADAKAALQNCDVIAGYKTYIDLIRDRFPGKVFMESGMKQETERCEACLDLAKSGKNVCLICSGDPGIYGMASPMLEIAGKKGFDNVVIIPGVTAALSGAALLGAPIGHDFCVISLSDLLTPWEKIEKRLICAAEADLCIVIYNPASKQRPEHLKRACNILTDILGEDRCCGIVRNIGRDGTYSQICSLSELPKQDTDMFTTVFIGNSQTKVSGNRLVTLRGYQP
ncbi:MAG: precorrin-3B C(17)-methyltransferase [Lachnospiraceae bacterium]|nr:precorrin-3B C(17)-methyltransferase [Lachnospiraceae bacterium]